jgi:2-alkenal reductase
MDRWIPRLFLLAAFGILSAGIGAAAGGLTAYWLVERVATDRGESGAAVPSSAQNAEGSELALASNLEDPVLTTVRKTRPAVVTVQNLQPVRQSVFAPIKTRPVSSGSGVIFDPRGYIATNAHVIHDAAIVEVIFIDGRRTPAEVVRWDAGYDVAVLKVPEGTELPAVAPLADSSQLEPGMRVLAIGSPLGTDYINTVTTGIIAGLNRRVKEQGFDLRTFEYREYNVVDVPLIQTDAAINTGNSGGPLIDMQGHVVGLNTLVVRRDQQGGSQVEGFGFSIPSNVLRALADEWIDGKPRADMGVEAVDIDPEVARESGLERAVGAAVMAVTPGGAGEAAGLRKGDVILAVEGRPLNLDRALADELWRYRAGDTVELEVDRFGDARTLRVKLRAPVGLGGRGDGSGSGSGNGSGNGNG